MGIRAHTQGEAVYGPHLVKATVKGFIEHKRSLEFMEKFMGLFWTHLRGLHLINDLNQGFFFLRIFFPVAKVAIIRRKM
jgi:hypothetical protein